MFAIRKCCRALKFNSTSRFAKSNRCASLSYNQLFNQSLIISDLGAIKHVALFLATGESIQTDIKISSRYSLQSPALSAMPWGRFRGIFIAFIACATSALRRLVGTPHRGFVVAHQVSHRVPHRVSQRMQIWVPKRCSREDFTNPFRRSNRSLERAD